MGVDLSVSGDRLNYGVDSAEKTENVKCKSGEDFKGRSTFIARWIAENVTVKQFGEKS